MMKSFLATLLITLIVGCDAIFEKDLMGRRVDVISPVDGAKANSGCVTFLWRAVDGAHGYRLIVVSPSFEMASRVAMDTVVDSLTRCSIMLDRGSYQWSIEGFNSAYRGESGIRNLEIE